MPMSMVECGEVSISSQDNLWYHVLPCARNLAYPKDDTELSFQDLPNPEKSQ